MQSCSKLTILFSLVIACVASGCVAITAPPARIDFRPNFDFSVIETIAFSQQQNNMGDDVLDEMVSQRIHAGLIHNLESKGLRVIDDGSQAQLLLRWQLSGEDRTDVEASKSNSYYMCWRCGSSITDIRVKKYTRGTFVVEFVDPATESSVWQGVMHGRLAPDRSVQDQEALIDAACTEILSNFPPTVELL